MKDSVNALSHAVLMVLLLLNGLVFMSCSEDETGGSPASNSTSNGTTTEDMCESLEECSSGQLCIQGDCVGCSGDEDCAGEPLYGQDARCDDSGLCSACVSGDIGCACYSNGTCNEGLRCGEDELCGTCPEGELGCSCDGNTCAQGLTCLEELCAFEDCTNSPMREGCPCVDDACNPGLTCTPGGMCAPCSNDILSCPCDDERSCAGRLVCDEDDLLCREALTCDEVQCQPEQLCGDEEEGEDAACLEQCNPGFVWNPVTENCDLIPMANCISGAQGSIIDQCAMLNRVCESEAGSAACGACLSGFLDDEQSEACRAVVRCGALGCNAQGRVCVESTLSTDATCGACLNDYEEDNAGQCVPESNCNPGQLGSILAQCDAVNRECNESFNSASCGGCWDGYRENELGECAGELLCSDLDCVSRGRACAGEPMAECGECLTGYIPMDVNNVDGDCRPALTCAVRQDPEQPNLACDHGQFCSEATEERDSICSDWPCVDVNGDPIVTQALDEGTGICRECAGGCGGEGETGRLWPFTMETGRCICETQDGFFSDPSGAVVATRCDSDGDGWVRDSVRSLLYPSNNTRPDPTLLANARCEVKLIDRFVLENEWRQSMTVMLCQEGTVAEFACTTNDECGVGACLGALGEGCSSGEVGCQCGCVRESSIEPVPLFESVRNDDANQLALDSDVPSYRAAGQGRSLQVEELNGLTRACVSEGADFNGNGLSDVSEGQDPDAVMDTEADSIYLQFSYFMETHRGWYEEGEGTEFGIYMIQERSRCAPDFPLGYDDVLDGNYWRDCTRNRDSRYNALSDDPQSGFDFARFSCHEQAEACPSLDPITELSAETDVAPHGQCEVSLPPADGVWRGMNHHSQFKCVVIDNEAPASPENNPHILVRDMLGNNLGQGLHQFNRCYADASEELGNGISSPNIVCDTELRAEVTSDDVGFVSRRYDHEALGYEAGCIDESLIWFGLCPGYEENPDGVVVSDSDDFGRLVCDCGYNYGGVNCSLGCPSEQVHRGGSVEGSTTRSGWWACGEVSVTTEPLLKTERWEMNGGIPLNGLQKPRMCEIDENGGLDCDSGWSLE